MSKGISGLCVQQQTKGKTCKPKTNSSLKRGTFAKQQVCQCKVEGFGEATARINLRKEDYDAHV
jgi:hypothetical protein